MDLEIIILTEVSPKEKDTEFPGGLVVSIPSSQCCNLGSVPAQGICGMEETHTNAI